MWLCERRWFGDGIEGAMDGVGKDERAGKMRKKRRSRSLDVLRSSAGPNRNSRVSTATINIHDHFTVLGSFIIPWDLKASDKTFC
jgi:hypothetical protein